MKNKIIIIGIIAVILLGGAVYVINKNGNQDDTNNGAPSGDVVSGEVISGESVSGEITGEEMISGDATSIDFVIEIYNQNQEDVNAGLEQLDNHEKFKALAENGKIDKAKQLLNLYEKGNIIKNLNYNEATQQFSFVYDFGELKGSLGGYFVEMPWEGTQIPMN